MDYFLTFLQEYFYLILLSLALLIVILIVIDIIAIVRANHSSIYDFIRRAIPTILNMAESIYGGKTGTLKKDFVITSVNDLLTKTFPKINVNYYGQFISNTIEELLSTPAKKEVSKNGK